MLAPRLFALLVVVFVGAQLARADVGTERAALTATHHQRLAELAAICDTQKLPELAARTRQWIVPREPDKLYFFDLPESPATVTSADSSDPRFAQWARRFQQLRDEQADKLYALAEQAVKDKRPSLAYELVLETARENPEHASARRLLGYVNKNGKWLTAFEGRQLAKGQVWDDQFGWLSKAHLERYRKGERYFQGRWLSAADEAAKRADIQQGWRIETDHFEVTTNHSQEEGVRMAQRLERLYAIWQQVFVRYLTSEAEVARRFAGAAPNFRDPKKHAVAYFRTREEYNQMLLPAQPQIAITLGIYFDSSQTAYFFAGEEQSAGTVFHEATHQLFQETKTVGPDVGKKNHFWIVEAIACYMETLTEHDGYWTLGGDNAGRLPAARQRLLVDNFYLPLAELTAMGRDDLQRHPNIARIYSQSAGLAAFLMHYDGGRYRDALVSYLDAVYSGKAAPQSLAEFAGRNYQQLDGDYRAFLTQVNPVNPN